MRAVSFIAFGVGLWQWVKGTEPAVALVILGVASALYLVFGSMTVSVDQDMFHFQLGSGWIRKRIPLSDLSSWRPVESHWIHGYGIRRYPGGWMYRVSGQRAVEIHLKSGGQLRVGTDAPEALCMALSAAVPQAPQAVEGAERVDS